MARSDAIARDYTTDRRAYYVDTLRDVGIMCASILIASALFLFFTRPALHKGSKANPMRVIAAGLGASMVLAVWVFAATTHARDPNAANTGPSLKANLQFPPVQLLVTDASPSQVQVPVTDASPSQVQVPVTDASPSQIKLPVTDASPSQVQLPVTDASPSQVQVPVTGTSPSQIEPPVTDASPSQVQVPVTDASPSVTEARPSQVQLPVTETRPSQVQLPVTAAQAFRYSPPGNCQRGTGDCRPIYFIMTGDNVPPSMHQWLDVSTTPARKHRWNLRGSQPELQQRLPGYAARTAARTTILCCADAALHPCTNNVRWRARVHWVWFSQTSLCGEKSRQRKSRRFTGTCGNLTVTSATATSHARISQNTGSAPFSYASSGNLISFSFPTFPFHGFLNPLGGSI